MCQKRLRQLVTAVADGAVAAETIVADYPLDQLASCVGPDGKDADGKPQNKTGADSRAAGQDTLIANVRSQIQGQEEEKKLYTGQEEPAVMDRHKEMRSSVQQAAMHLSQQMEGVLRPDSRF